MQFFREDFEILVSLKNKAVSFKVELHKDWYGKEFWSKVSNETYEPDTIKFVENFCDKSTDFVDIGAANGAFSLIAFSLGARVYAFEPNHYLYKNFLKNISKKDSDIYVKNFALGNKNEEKFFYMPYYKSTFVHYFSSFDKEYIYQSIKMTFSKKFTKFYLKKK